MPVQKYEAIIIGSGMAGLTCGTMLAKNGVKTLILEKHIFPGGYCTNFKRKGYTFDASLHMINGGDPGGSTHGVLQDCGVRISYHEKGKPISPIQPDEVRLIKIDPIYHLKDLGRDSDFFVPGNIEEFQDKLIEKFPEQEKKIKNYLKDVRKLVNLMFKFLSVGLLGKIKLFLTRLPTFGKLYSSLSGTAGDLLNKHGITDQHLIDLLTILSGFFALPPEKVSQTIYLVGMFGYFVEGAYQVMGGSGALASAVAEKFKQYGGDLKLRTPVEEILLNESLRQATGVRVSDGTTYTGDVIIVNADATHAFNELIKLGEDALESNKRLKNFIEKINSREPSLSAVICYIGLDLDLKKYGYNDYELGFKEKDFTWEEMQPILKTAEFEKIPDLPLTIYSNIDPTCCPEGKSVLSSIYLADVEPFKELLDSKGERGERYLEFKQNFARHILKKTAEHLQIPDLESKVEVMEVATPLTLKRYTNNRNGAFIGWKVTPDQQIFNQLPQKTPIKNLYLTSAWAGLGGGVSAVMMSGREAARTISKKLKK